MHSLLQKKRSPLLSGRLELVGLSPQLLLWVLLNYLYLLPSILTPLIYCCAVTGEGSWAGSQSHGASGPGRAMEGCLLSYGYSTERRRHPV